jgi:hypothetical protein
VSPLYQHGGKVSVIPPGWAEHHRPVTESTMTFPGTIHRITAGPPPYPKPFGWAPEVLLHSTYFRVQQMNREGGGTPGEQPTVERRYLLVAPFGIPELQVGERGDIIRVVGREFRVQQVLHGTLLWETDIICIDNMTQQNPV